MLFETLDFFYCVLLSYIIGHYGVLLVHCLTFACVYRINTKCVFSSVVISRFVYFSIAFGFENSEVFLTICNVYLRNTLGDGNGKKIALILLFLSSFYLFANITLPCTIPNDRLISLNILTRIYVIYYCVIEILIFKYFSVQRENELSKEADNLLRMEHDELKFMKRFSHFARTSMNGIINFLEFLKIKGLHVKKNEESSQSSDRYGYVAEEDILSLGQGRDRPRERTTALALPPSRRRRRRRNEKKANISVLYETIESSCSEICDQITDLVEFYRVRRKGDETDEYHVTSSQPIKKTVQEKCEIRKVVDYVIRVQSKLRLDCNETKKEKVKIELFIDDSVPNIILMEHFFLSKILTNLISNAVKYTKEGTVKIHIRINKSKSLSSLTSQKDEENEDNNNNNLLQYLEIRVTDTGVGITKRVLDRIFEPFVKNEEYKTQESFSIGLVITKSIIERLQGTITVDSPGKDLGTKVQVILPLGNQNFGVQKQYQQQQQQHEELEEEETEGEEEEEFSDVSGNYSDLSHVLIVEDNPINQKVFEKQIELTLKKKIKNLEIIQAWNGKEGLEKLEEIIEYNPLIFCDIDMPIMKGNIFVKHARRLYGTKLVIFAFTATFVGSEEKYRNFGFDGVEQKPITFTRMKEVVVFMTQIRRMKSFQFGEKIIDQENNDIVKKIDDYEDQEEEEEEELIKNYVKKDVQKVLFMVDILSTISQIILTCFSAFFMAPLEYRSGWLIYSYSWIITSLMQYSTVFLLGISVENNCVLSMLRVLFCMIVGSEFANFKFFQDIYFTQLTFIFQATQSIESFWKSSIITIFFCVQIVFYELMRDSDNFFLANLVDFFIFVRHVCLGFVSIFMIVLVFVFERSTQEKKKRLEKIIDNKMKIEEDYNVVMSKVSHDMVTPASALMIHLEELGGMIMPSISSMPSTYSEAYELMVFSSIGLEVSIHNFLASCKLRNGMCKSIITDHLFIKEFIKNMFQQILKIVHHQQETKLSLSFNDENILENTAIDIDLLKIRLIFMNLLLNSIIHSKAKNVHIKVDLCDNNNNNEDDPVSNLEFLFCDDGVGIPEDIIEKINEKTSSLDSDSNPRRKLRFKERFLNSLGLGLMVCKYLSELLEGEFRICNSTRKSTNLKEIESFLEDDCSYSTIIKVSIPCNISTSKNEKTMNNDNSVIEDEEKLPKTSTFLCVDDSPIVVMYVKMYLTKIYGFKNVLSCCDEEECIKLLQKHQIDVLVSDMNLNTMNTIQMLNCLEDFEKNKPKKLIVFSGSSEKEIRSISEGLVDGFIPKPVHPDTLKSCLKKFVDF